MKILRLSQPALLNCQTPDLKPQTIGTTEAALKYLFKDIFILDANVFYSESTGLINPVLVPSGS